MYARGFSLFVHKINLFVQALEVCENDLCYQLVMEKHGSGMDLFEFIERQPKLDEPLASFIFRQVVAAASHLHSLGIVHRDVSFMPLGVFTLSSMPCLDQRRECYYRSTFSL